jgi:tyrosine decarboxylase/aspartate 1-decarboxylase
MKTTMLLTRELKTAKCRLVTAPTLNIVAFRSPMGTKHLAQNLLQRGWFVSYVPRYDCIRVVVMSHVKNQHALAFVADIRDIENIQGKILS